MSPELVKGERLVNLFFLLFLEHVSTLVPTVDNIHTQIYMYIYAT